MTQENSQTDVGNAGTPYTPMTDDQQLVYTQKIRRDFIDQSIKDKILEKGERGDKALVIQVLNDMDRSALTNKKIKTDSTNGAVTAQAAMVVASMLERMSANSMKQSTPVLGQNKPPELPVDYPAPELVPGETEVAAAPMNYKSFMGEQNKRLGRTSE